MGKPKLTVLKPSEDQTIAEDVDHALQELGKYIKENALSKLLFIGKDKDGMTIFLFNDFEWTECELQGTLVQVGHKITDLYDGEE